ncbi:23S rRNA (uracil(1939)-C(5))-methyltransferase RlmD [Natroniella sulfidigena]|uniref:23S rRNA (uracil(1939)-C(5))-methyltransferase RlmD n=1 Tax=Natroniella sulfidigena TaxID=723921 RepID=UPI00200A204D|nr:23S rRNA (uracil(1939)-C(5))-methyltransferase RlmD [Natroniella sulfidigena]MCK8816049.1 23S rRNA (uracil(1939)-C(5))-methyltransferase RlmD [Natroniella sulfidigena]
MGAKPIKVGEEIIIELEDLATGGDAVGRVDGFVIFIPGGIPGETVKVEITQVKKSYGRAKIIEVIEQSAERVQPSCQEDEDCGGCQISYLDYQAQLKYKRKIVRDTIERIAKLTEVEVNPVKGMDNPFFYRNKAQFPVAMQEEEVITGFYALGTHQLIELDDCRIQHPLINRVIREAIELIEEYEVSIYDEQQHQGLLRHLVVRVGVCTNQAMLIFVTKDEEFPAGVEIATELLERIPELVSINQNINPEETNVVLGRRTKQLVGQDHIIDYIGPIKYKISPLAFFQVNTLQAKVLYDQVVEYAQLSGSERVLDAYCGVGSIALYLARFAKEVWGIEVVEEAIKAAKENAELNGIDNCKFKVGKVRNVLPRLKEELKPEVIVVDPPRKGCHQEVLATFAELEPERIVYVSCDPASLARDLKYLTEVGYQVEEIQPVDMFPQTFHVETVVVLEKI